MYRNKIMKGCYRILKPALVVLLFMCFLMTIVSVVMSEKPELLIDGVSTTVKQCMVDKNGEVVVGSDMYLDMDGEEVIIKVDEGMRKSTLKGGDEVILFPLKKVLSTGEEELLTRSALRSEYSGMGLTYTVFSFFFAVGLAMVMMNEIPPEETDWNALSEWFVEEEGSTEDLVEEETSGEEEEKKD